MTTANQAGGLLEIPTYKREDFTSDQDVRWCPGCGDYSILAQVQRTMPEICKRTGTRQEEVVFISGIGCSSRFPYYMDTYGFHSIHGRAPTLASGLKISRPELQVWVVTGDGDGLSIGGNHLIHCLRRNLDLNILLFNNRIYGLTKGQYSPTSELGKKTKSSPMGSAEHPINPIATALASRATFVARAIDTDSTGLQTILLRAALHKGAAFVEILQNCNVFNDKAFESFTERKVRAERMVSLEHGKPLIFGENRDRAIVLDRSEGLQAKVVNVADVNPSEIVVHNESAPTSALAFTLSHLLEPDFPVPLGVFRAVERPSFEDLIDQQIEAAVAAKGKGDFEELLNGGDTWEV